MWPSVSLDNEMGILVPIDWVVLWSPNPLVACLNFFAPLCNGTSQAWSFCWWGGGVSSSARLRSSSRDQSLTELCSSCACWLLDLVGTTRCCNSAVLVGFTILDCHPLGPISVLPFALLAGTSLRLIQPTAWVPMFVEYQLPKGQYLSKQKEPVPCAPLITCTIRSAHNIHNQNEGKATLVVT